MATSTIPLTNPAPKALTVTKSSATGVSIINITAYKIGYLVVVYYNITTTSANSSYQTIATISNASTYDGITVTTPTGATASGNAFCKIQVTSDGTVQFASRNNSGTFTGSFCYLSSTFH